MGHSSVFVVQSVFRQTYLIVFPSGHVPAVFILPAKQVGAAGAAGGAIGTGAAGSGAGAESLLEAGTSLIVVVDVSFVVVTAFFIVVPASSNTLAKLRISRLFPLFETTEVTVKVVTVKKRRTKRLIISINPS